MPPPRRSGPPPRKPPEVNKVLSDTREHLQDSLFEVDTDWQKEWQGMPECVNEDLVAFKSVTVNFTNFDDIKVFSGLVGQNVTIDTQSIWFPKVEFDRVANLRYLNSKKSKRPVYHEWRKANQLQDIYDCKRTLPPEVEVEVLAYDDCMHLLQ